MSTVEQILRFRTRFWLASTNRRFTPRGGNQTAAVCVRRDSGPRLASGWWADNSEILIVPAKALVDLFPLIYDELRRLADSIKLANENSGQTFQPTDLVHEAYVPSSSSHRAVRGETGLIFSAQLQKRFDGS